MQILRVMRKPRVSSSPPAFSPCGGCVTPKKCKAAEVCDVQTFRVSTKRPKNRATKKISVRGKEQIKARSRDKKDAGSLQAG